MPHQSVSVPLWGPSTEQPLGQRAAALACSGSHRQETALPGFSGHNWVCDPLPAAASTLKELPLTVDRMTSFLNIIEGCDRFEFKDSWWQYLAARLYSKQYVDKL